MQHPAKDSQAGNFQEVAWNGVRCRVPPSWDIGAIGNRHLVFENGSGAVAEFKWDRPKKQPEPKKLRKQLTESAKRRLPGGVSEWTPPQSWISALSAYRVAGFSWKDGKSYGKGCAIGCPDCGTISLIQFFSQNDAPPPYAKQILSSYRDHSEKERVLWSVYGMRAELPRNLALDKFRFQPGAFMLSFTGTRCKLTLFRWAAAATLLRKRNLAEFAVGIPEIGVTESSKTDSNGADRLHFEIHPRSGVVSGLKNLFPNRRGHRWIHIRHDKPANKILAARLDGRDADAGALILSVTDSFTSV